MVDSQILDGKAFSNQLNRICGLKPTVCRLYLVDVVCDIFCLTMPVPFVLVLRMKTSALLVCSSNDFFHNPDCPRYLLKGGEYDDDGPVAGEEKGERSGSCPGSGKSIPHGRLLYVLPAVLRRPRHELVSLVVEWNLIVQPESKGYSSGE